MTDFANDNPTGNMTEDGNFVLTRDGYEHLKAEMERLEAQAAENQANFNDVMYSGDPTPDEAAEFETRDTREFTLERLGHLKLILENAQVLEDNDPETVDIGDRVTVREVISGRKEARESEVFDLRNGEEIIAGLDGVSIDSPIGQALNGKRVGDVITVEIPDGQVKYAIKAITPIPVG